MQGDLLRFVLVNLLRHYFMDNKSMSSNHTLRWSLWKWSGCVLSFVSRSSV